MYACIMIVNYDDDKDARPDQEAFLGPFKLKASVITTHWSAGQIFINIFEFILYIYLEFWIVQ